MHTNYCSIVSVTLLEILNSFCLLICASTNDSVVVMLQMEVAVKSGECLY